MPLDTSMRQRPGALQKSWEDIGGNGIEEIIKYIIEMLSEAQKGGLERGRFQTGSLGGGPDSSAAFVPGIPTPKADLQYVAPHRGEAEWWKEAAEKPSPVTGGIEEPGPPAPSDGGFMSWGASPAGDRLGGQAQGRAVQAGSARIGKYQPPPGGEPSKYQGMMDSLRWQLEAMMPELQNPEYADDPENVYKQAGSLAQMLAALQGVDATANPRLAPKDQQQMDIERLRAQSNENVARTQAEGWAGRGTGQEELRLQRDAATQNQLTPDIIQKLVESIQGIGDDIVDPQAKAMMIRALLAKLLGGGGGGPTPGGGAAGRLGVSFGG